MSDKYIVDWEIGKKLKELGFNEKCETMLITKMKPQNWVKPERNSETDDDEFMLPTVDEAAKWIREKYKKFIDAFPDNYDYGREEEIWYGQWSFDIYEIETGHCIYASCGSNRFDSYNETMNFAIKYVLENIDLL